MKNVNHIVWADLIRVIAILMVICIHCSDPFNVSPEARLNPEYNLWGSIYGAFLRPCVPLFVMLTGMLLLPVEQEIGQFYKKRMLRVIVPFIVWSLLYNLFPWFTGILGLNNSVLSEMFAYAGEIMGKLISIWSFIRRRKYLITVVAFAVIIGFLDENSLVRRFGYEREISQLKEEIEKYRADYEENTKRLNEITTNPDAIEQIAREKYLMKKPNEDIYVFED